VTKVRQAEAANREFSMLEQRVELLERQLSAMESDVHRLREIEEFHEQLKAPET
jgi:predicted  nucleic acid-binding Zn-ribbon protein